jgi:hypothetical protein
VRYLQRKSLLTSEHSFSLKWTCRGEPTGDIVIQPGSDRIILSYRSRTGRGEWEQLNYAVELERVPCHLGGERIYFRCPAVRCGRRVAILYGGRIFACRRMGRETQGYAWENL